MIIRLETPADYDAIRAVLIAAFADHPYSRQTEHLIVEGLRADGAMTAALAAEIDGRVVGHIAFSPVTIAGADCRWLGLGPVAVTPELQKKGIGSKLVGQGLDAIRSLGERGCVLVGDPEFYQRFGFRNDRLQTMPGVPPRNLLCLPFDGEVPQGEVAHHPAFFACE